jgi:hypothetical protein
MKPCLLIFVQQKTLDRCKDNEIRQVMLCCGNAKTLHTYEIAEPLVVLTATGLSSCKFFLAVEGF